MTMPGSPRPARKYPSAVSSLSSLVFHAEMTATMTVKNRKLSAIQIMELKNDILFLSLSLGEIFGFVNGLVHLTITG